MKKITRFIVAVAVIALFATGFQAKPIYYYAGGSKNGEVPVVPG
jgi:hypothetical protein